MKRDEIRLGNYVLYNDVEFRQISSIHSDDTIRLKDNSKGCIGCFSLRNPLIKPIILTDDILIKNCGFYKTFDGFSNELTTSVHFYIDESYCIYYEDFCVTFTYLHELQNAFKVITGEELNIIIP
jgi:hypothetical protein